MFEDEEDMSYWILHASYIAVAHTYRDVYCELINHCDSRKEIQIFFESRNDDLVEVNVDLIAQFGGKNMFFLKEISAIAGHLIEATFEFHPNNATESPIEDMRSCANTIIDLVLNEQEKRTNES